MLSYKTIILVRMGEIALKGLNRGQFEKRLIANLKFRLGKLGQFSIMQRQSRIWVDGIKDNEASLQDPLFSDRVLQAITDVFGIVSASRVRSFSGDLDAICAQCLNLATDLYEKKPYDTFKIVCKRANKAFPILSIYVAKDVGAYVLKHMPKLSVDIHHPDRTIFVEIRDDIYIYSNIVYGHRGLPVGTAGKGMLLLSGGIDSPVAGYMMASRGMELEACYFHSYPYTSEEAKTKVLDLAKILSRFSGKISLHVVDFTAIQLELYEKTPHDMLTITMRRVMLLIAEKLAQQRGCKALITGESLAQVASQTLDALVVTDAVVSMPVFRPLIGLDKEATTIISRKIGAFDTSILPYEDCCTVFVAKHPKTHPHMRHVLRAEQGIDIMSFVEQGCKKVDMIAIQGSL